ncbi:hypothetical protein VTO42DRAFT_309 [Malbranchea cinnamomea]
MAVNYSNNNNNNNNGEQPPDLSKSGQAMAVGIHNVEGVEGGAAYLNLKGKKRSLQVSTDAVAKEEGEAMPRRNEGGRRQVLLSTSTPFSETVVRSLFRDPDIDLRIIAQEDDGQDSVGVNVPFYEDIPSRDYRKTCSSARKWLNTTAARLADWADMLIVAPADSGTIGAMIAGLTSTLTLTVFRGWDASKTILLVPGMTLGEWKSPLTRRQLDELRAFWPWVKVLPPVFSRFEPPNTLVEMPWEGREMFYEELRKGLGWKAKNGKPQGDGTLDTTIVHASDMHLENRETQEEKRCGTSEEPQNAGQLVQTPSGSKSPMQRRRRPDEPALPFELITMILEELGDWEIASAVGVYTRIPVPAHWRAYCPDPNSPAPLSLEYTILRRPFSEIKEKLSALPQWKPLSNLAAHLILKLCRTDILNFICKTRIDLYWATTCLANLPVRASGVYGSTALLDWWLACPDIPTNDYLPDAVDSASRAGFVHVLDWWRNCGLPLRYTERALESASAEGQIAVLDWWKRVSDSAPEYDPVPLKIGKSVLLAAQSGKTASLEWWDKSGIPFSHAESVARIASTHGHVPVLDLWYELKGSKLIFDNQVLVGATKNGHVDVLEWWRRSGLRVEFKTCDIEEALEDAVSGAGERVRQWWERNGLNLGVGPSEWMKVKVL